MLVKTPKEIDKMQIAGRFSASVLKMIEPFVVPGVTTGELERVCRKYIVDDLQAIPASLNHHGFPGLYLHLS